MKPHLAALTARVAFPGAIARECGAHTLSAGPQALASAQPAPARQPGLRDLLAGVDLRAPAPPRALAQPHAAVPDNAVIAPKSAEPAGSTGYANTHPLMLPVVWTWAAHAHYTPTVPEVLRSPNQHKVLRLWSADILGVLGETELIPDVDATGQELSFLVVGESPALLRLREDWVLVAQGSDVVLRRMRALDWPFVWPEPASAYDAMGHYLRHGRTPPAELRRRLLEGREPLPLETARAWVDWQGERELRFQESMAYGLAQDVLHAIASAEDEFTIAALKRTRDSLENTWQLTRLGLDFDTLGPLLKLIDDQAEQAGLRGVHVDDTALAAEEEAWWQA